MNYRFYDYLSNQVLTGMQWEDDIEDYPCQNIIRANYSDFLTGIYENNKWLARDLFLRNLDDYPESNRDLWNKLSCDPAIVDVEFLPRCAFMPLNWEIITRSPLIKITDIVKTPGLPWRWDLIHARSDFVSRFIFEFIDKPLDWESLDAQGYIVDAIVYHANNPASCMTTYSLETRRIIMKHFHINFSDYEDKYTHDMIARALVKLAECLEYF